MIPHSKRNHFGALLCAIMIMIMAAPWRAGASEIEEARGYAVEVERASYALYREAEAQDRDDRNVGDRALQAFLNMAQEATQFRQALQRPPGRLRELLPDFETLSEIHRISVPYRGTLRPTRAVRDNCAIVDRRMADLERLFRNSENGDTRFGWSAEDLREARRLATRMTQDAEAVVAFVDAIVRRDPRDKDEIRGAAKAVAMNAASLRAALERVNEGPRSTRPEFKRLLESFTRLSISFGTLRLHDGGASLTTQLARTMDRISRAYLVPSRRRPSQEDARQVAMIMDEIAQSLWYAAKSEVKDGGGKAQREGLEAFKKLTETADDLDEAIKDVNGFDDLLKTRGNFDRFQKALNRAGSAARVFGEHIRGRLPILLEAASQMNRFYEESHSFRGREE